MLLFNVTSFFKFPPKTYNKREKIKRIKNTVKLQKEIKYLHEQADKPKEILLNDIEDVKLIAGILLINYHNVTVGHGNMKRFKIAYSGEK
jgi:hypothetical protein